MHLSTLTTHFVLLALTILLLATTSLSNPLTQDLQLVDGKLIPAGYKYEPLSMTGTIVDITLNHTGTIQEILAQIKSENPGFKIGDLSTAARPALSLDKVSCIFLP